MSNKFNTLARHYSNNRVSMSSPKSPTDEVETLSMDELRDEYPSGWRILVQNESVGYILDALMDALPGTEFTKSELASEAGVSRQSVYTHLDLLLALEVLEPVERSSPQRYRVNAESELLDLLHQVNGMVNQQLAG
jgi:DNA-binding transcriptional ArsR family regulator